MTRLQQQKKQQQIERHSNNEAILHSEFCEPSHFATLHEAEQYQSGETSR